MSALDEMTQLVDHAKPIPLTPEVRVNGVRMRALSAELRRSGASNEHLVDELDAVLAAAKTVPFTDELRIRRKDILPILDRLRAGGA